MSVASHAGTTNGLNRMYYSWRQQNNLVEKKDRMRKKFHACPRTNECSWRNFIILLYAVLIDHDSCVFYAYSLNVADSNHTSRNALLVSGQALNCWVNTRESTRELASAHPNDTQMYRLLVRTLAIAYFAMAVSYTTVQLCLNLSRNICHIISIDSCSQPLSSFTWTGDRATLRASHGDTWNRSLFVSKLFDTAPKLMDVMPYYYRASHGHENEDVTVATIVTSNRFEALARLVEQYQGGSPLSGW
ncbi:hypothetical protein AG1IA_06765 [Rhizoctonia solani AG-1 IA]|uniref:Uncharacterized protein n=1 Tax=Thanatephorus cucumeris (strain AG1-IA) TaxID=983506 RepID=L8WR27_THACA|nr:hypothetical protein AG1IA_06765 [Rhizoctonia solani AG-1 IA]